MKNVKKYCSNCRKLKKLSKFYNDCLTKDGKVSQCKKCRDYKTLQRIRTKEGVIKQAFDSQVASSKRRGHKVPKYTKQELIDWALKQDVFHKLHKKWKKSGYEKDLKPSFDRLDDYKGYSLKRLRIVTWKENNKKGHIDIITGKRNTNQITPVIGINKITGKKVKFYSMSEAARKTGTWQNNISACCKYSKRTTGGFYWKYAKKRKE